MPGIAVAAEIAGYLKARICGNRATQHAVARRHHATKRNKTVGHAHKLRLTGDILINRMKHIQCAVRITGSQRVGMGKSRLEPVVCVWGARGKSEDGKEED